MHAAVDSSQRGTTAGASPPQEPPPLRPLRLILSTLGVLTVVMLVAGVLGLAFADPLIALSRWFVEELGGPGIAVAFMVPDALCLPFPADVASSAGILGGMDFAEVVIWGSVGSLIGGSAGWAIGRYFIASRPRLQRYIDRRGGADVRRQLRRYGAVFVAVAAVTPLPYSVACWAAGAIEMPYPRFLAVSLLRIVRVALYLWLIERGLLSVIS